jgi:hypothetical protein
MSNVLFFLMKKRESFNILSEFCQNYVLKYNNNNILICTMRNNIYLNELLLNYI